MPLQAELYAAVAEDVELMNACFRPMGFATRHIEAPVEPAQAREWLAACTPLLERLGSKASEELLQRVRWLRERWPGWELEPGDTDAARQFTVNLNVHSLFQMLAAEFLKKGMRRHAEESFIIQHEVVLEAFQLIHFDRKLLVPTWAVHDESPARTFASSPITHTPFGRYYLWRSAEQVRAFFKPRFRFFRAPEDLLKPPSPEQLVALKHERGRWVSSTNALESARREINAYQGHWSTLVELLRTAARLGGAFISVCQDITDYE